MNSPIEEKLERTKITHIPGKCKCCDNWRRISEIDSEEYQKQVKEMIKQKQAIRHLSSQMYSSDQNDGYKECADDILSHPLLNNK